MRMLRTATCAAVIVVVALASGEATARTVSLSAKTAKAPTPSDPAAAGKKKPAAKPASDDEDEVAAAAPSGVPRPESDSDIAANKKANEDAAAAKKKPTTAGGLAPLGAKKAPRKKRNRKNKKKEKPVEVVDLMLDVAGTMCDKLGTLVKRKKFSVASRCDLLKFCIEDLTGMFDAMASELDLTQQDLVDNALQMHHFMNFQMNMKKVVKMVLAEQKPTEKYIGDELNRMMSQWILNVATGQSKNSGGNLGKLSREAQKNLRAMGIGLPSYGQMDDDDLEEEQALIGEDYSWADESNKIAEIYEALDDEDDDDDLL